MKEFTNNVENSISLDVRDSLLNGNSNMGFPSGDLPTYISWGDNKYTE